MQNAMPRHTKKRIGVIMLVLIVLSLLIVFLTTRPPSSLQQHDKQSTFSDDGIIGVSPIEALSADEAFSGDMAPPEAKNIARMRPEAITPQPPEDTDTYAPDPTNTIHLIKTGTLTIRVPSRDDAVEAITTIAREAGGDVTHAYFSADATTRKNGTLTVKVPVEHFDRTMNAIKKIASIVEYESIDTADVTQQVIDLDIRYKNKKAQEERLRAFYDRAENVQDLLKIEQRLTVVRGEIEQINAQRKNLSNRTVYSMITVTLIEDTKVIPPQTSWRPGQVAKDALHSLITKTQHLIDNAIEVIIEKLPLFILSLIALWIAYSISKKLLLFFANKINHKD